MKEHMYEGQLLVPLYRVQLVDASLVSRQQRLWESYEQAQRAMVALWTTGTCLSSLRVVSGKTDTSLQGAEHLDDLLLQNGEVTIFAPQPRENIPRA